MPETKRSDRGAVMITGTSTGIGAATAVLLADLGFDVFAGLRRATDLGPLRAKTTGSLTPVLIDITDEASIAAAAAKVGAAVGERGLAGLVNNAGIVRPGPLEHQPMADFRLQFEVNLFGQVAVTQAFLPLIRRGHGRIVNVGSIGGRLAVPMHGAYSASKFGMEAVSDALRLELRQWGIPVSHVDPGGTATAIFGKTLAEIDRVTATLDASGITRYDGQLAAVRRFVEKTAADPAPATDLAKAIGEAMTASRPKARYLAGKEAKETVAMSRTLSDHLKDIAVAKLVGLPDPE